MFIKSTSRFQYADAPKIEVKAEADGKITGYGSVWDVVDGYNERVIKGAFAKSLAEHQARGSMPKMLWQHQTDRPIGRWEAMKEDGRGLYVEGRLNLKTSSGRDAYEHLVSGDVDAFSIGYREKQVKPGTVRDLLELDLQEVSVVTFPANREALTETIKSLQSKTELVDMLREGGLSKQAAQLVASGGWKALSKETAFDDDAAARLAALIDRATRNIEDMK
ncbi:HK97 family phage prohead protease [Tianweitania sp. BSSL-BM11]|uniref:HK97 family phage prohead protease n=2 Tax=Tianweitania aestuarii TaxID=2814886 RepID=A0ABS5RX32_9HYPH|nr:HK97 family phage prohead protease [Tianweitania aestuarii]